MNECMVLSACCAEACVCVRDPYLDYKGWNLPVPKGTTAAFKQINE